MLLTVIGWSFQLGPNEGMIWGLIGGLALDLASGAPVGISPLPLMVAALIAGIGRRRVFHSNIVLPALISLFAMVLYQIIYLILLVIVGQPVSWQEGILHTSLPLTLLNLGLMPIVYLVMLWLARLVQGTRVQLG